MNITIKKYVAKVARFVEHEDGTITKRVEEITLDGKRFKPATVWKAIPRDCKLIDSGWRNTCYEVDEEKLEKFLREHGKEVAENPEK